MVPAYLRIPLLKAAIAILLFGTVPAALSHVSTDSFSLGLVRLLVPAIALTAMLAAAKQLHQVGQLTWTQWKVVITIGLLFGLHWLTYFLSIKEGSAAIGAIGFTTYGVQIPLLGWLFGFGRPSLRTFAALGLALCGAAFCVLDSLTEVPALSSTDQPKQLGAWIIVGVLSGTIYAALPLLHQRYAEIPNAVRTWGQFAFALPVFLLTAPLAEWNFPVDQLWLIVYLSLVITLAAHFLWIQAATVLPISITGVLAYLQLPTSLAFAWLLIDEPITLSMLFGAALVIVANAMAISDRPN
ncbi:DMT family transporter [Adhaeretor mobilis]|uniref:EamA-like transporter family protein n=1 Tax=Adhaeretor mobilis TaxID=1930276 RepID=A0A517N2E9_9BACT|nr:DMT family transporter [Adhaeretor mobilis]QDT01305.1 EamA-like transporter family protein [Adhaeretor mobilis]